MMLRSWSNTLVSVRQVTQRNAGRATAGVDGQVALTSRARLEIAVLVHRTAKSFQPFPVRRVYRPESQWETQTARDSHARREHAPGDSEAGMNRPVVLGAASPDDPALTDYWAQRRGKNKPLLDRSVLILLTKQNSRCALCQDLLLHADHEPRSPTEWEQWHRVTRKAITKQYVTAHADKATPDNTRLVHSHCQRRATGARKDPALLYA
jgi:hypothetical protein